MSRKVRLSCVYASSEDPRHGPAELNSHAPTVRGWQSERGAPFPQELVVRLETRAKLYKIQVLVHQFLISEKLELWVSDDAERPLAALDWEYLGYITLADNQSTGFKSRELKSVTVPGCMATHLKIVLAKNHVNVYNIHNQVSLIAVNTLGCVDNDTDTLEQHPSPYDDLAFEMYVDPEVADVIRDMENKKHKAVQNERFEYARKLKHAMEQLRTAGERLSKYELEKRHAIEVEDYDRARQKKTTMEEYRRQVYTQLAVERLLEAQGTSAKNDECDIEDNAQQQLKVPGGGRERAASPQQTSPLHAAKLGEGVGGSPPAQQRTGSFRRRNKSAGAIVKSSYEQYEERALPALRHSQTNEFLRECQMEPDVKTVSKLTEREKKQAALPIVVFGTELVERFYSKQWTDKEEGLARLREELRCYSAASLHTANKTARAAVFLLHRALRDKVFSVYSLANEVIRLLFAGFVPGRVSAAEVARCVDRLLPELLAKAGDQAARVHHMAVHTILSVAECRAVAELHLVPVQLSRPVSGATHPRLALSRLEMVEQLIMSRGIHADKASGLACRTLAECGVSGLHHPAEPVRKAAERVLVHVYRVNPRLVRKQLPPDDDITRRNLLYRQLFHEFDKIDVARKKALVERNRLIQQLPLPPPSPTPVPHHDSLQNGGGGGSEAASSSTSASGVSSPGGGGTVEERRCIFCMSAVHGSSDDVLNVHYWRRCAMLTRCAHCSQVVEVAGLEAHLGEEHGVSVGEAAPEGHVRCPLCHAVFEEGEACWRTHLIACPANTRAHHKQVKIQTT